MDLKLKEVIKSIGITLFVSGLIGLCSYLIYPKLALAVSLGILSIMFQVIVYNLWKQTVNYKYLSIARENEAKAIEFLSRFTTKVYCAYCNKENTIPVIINDDNVFECTSCKKKSKIIVTLTPAQVTDPLVNTNIQDYLNKNVKDESR